MLIIDTNVAEYEHQEVEYETNALPLLAPTEMAIMRPTLDTIERTFPIRQDLGRRVWARPHDDIYTIRREILDREEQSRVERAERDRLYARVAELEALEAARQAAQQNRPVLAEKDMTTLYAIGRVRLLLSVHGFFPGSDGRTGRSTKITLMKFEAALRSIRNASAHGGMPANDDTTPIDLISCRHIMDMEHSVTGREYEIINQTYKLVYGVDMVNCSLLSREMRLDNLRKGLAFEMDRKFDETRTYQYLLTDR